MENKICWKNWSRKVDKVGLDLPEKETTIKAGYSSFKVDFLSSSGRLQKERYMDLSQFELGCFIYPMGQFTNFPIC